MAKKKSKKRRKAQQSSSKSRATGTAQSATGQSDTEESRGAEALTVALILAAMATLLAELVASAGQIALLSEPKWRTIDWLQALPRIMLLIASVTGVICLMLNPVVSRVRQVKLPLVVTVGITIMSIAPIVTMLLRS
jgi:hypothetical protein